MIPSRGWVPGRLPSLLAALACLLLPPAARAAGGPAVSDGFRLTAAADPARQRGPGHALGAVIWTHGRSTTPADPPDLLPAYLGPLAAAGWDAFRFDRPWARDDFAQSPTALRAQILNLRGQGYRRVVLAGQSLGAWLALMAAGAAGSADQIPYAVIALAPAAYGPDPTQAHWRDNATLFTPLLAPLHGLRVAIGLFADDPFDPGGRGVLARASLAGDNALLLLDHPAGWSGHLAGFSPAFAHRYGPCLVRFLDPARPQVDAAARADCDSDPVTPAGLGLPMPADLQIPAPPSPAGLPSGLAELRGVWTGAADNGRDVALTIERITGIDVTAIYSWGARADGDGAPAGFTRRTGRWTGDQLLFTAPGQASLGLRASADGGARLSVQPGTGMAGMAVNIAVRRLPGPSR